MVNGNQLYRVKFGKSTSEAAQTVSERQGYGMLITVMMTGKDLTAQTTFDGLFRYARAM